MSGLREKWFPSEREELDEELRVRDEIAGLRSRQAKWVTAEYMEEFKQKLETWLMANEPKPASHEEMLFTSGTRKGLLLVKGHVEMLERQLKESRNVGD